MTQKAEKGEMAEGMKKMEKISVPIPLSDVTFTEALKKYPLLIVDCYADWCGPCKMLAPVIEELAKENAGKAVFGKLNVDENQDTAMKFGIMSIPTLLVMKNGEEIDRVVGAAPKAAMQEKLKKYF